MSNTSNLVLPYLAVGQAQKHVTVNETLRKLDAIIQLSVVSATTAAEPSTPTDGAVYIIPAGKSGTHWAAFANWSLGYYRDGAWIELSPREGWIAFVKDTDQLLFYTSSAWSLFPAAKILAVSATDKLIGRSTSDAGAAEEIACTAAGRALLDDADAAAQRTTLGLGTAAAQNTGASGANVPLLNVANTWSAQQAAAVTSAGAAATPLILRNAGSTANTETVLQLNPSGSAARYAEIAAHNDGSNTISIIVRPSSGGMLFDVANFHINGVNIAGILQADNIQPRLDDSFDLGTASLRFDDVYATNGVIQTSDASEKSGLRALGDAERRAIRRVISGIGAFQWRSALAQKGEDARIHCGVTAQAVKDAFEAEGLDPGRYALFCADAVDEAVPLEEAEEAPDAVAGAARITRRPKLDGQGEPVMRLGVRYDQLFAMALAAIAA
ncbi:MAG TPA: DUF2793 domain-containing protein [Hyphomonadaceae bacterium]|jgi:hypothetical protein|nr:DUF2793 domain-containing protein [Hyphomonadaceae bacterium]